MNGVLSTDSAEDQDSEHGWYRTDEAVISL